MKIGKTLGVTVGLLGLGLLGSLSCAANDTDTGTFQTSNQDMWNSGGAFSFSANPTLFDIPLNSSNTVGSINCFLGVCGGATLTGSTSGDFGAVANLNVNGGTVNAAVPITVNEGFPTAPVPGNTPINITSNGMFGVGTLSTASPSIQASVGTIGSISASLSGEICVLGCLSGNIASVGPASLATTLFSVNSATFPPQTLSLGSGVNLNIGLPFVATNGSAGPQTFPPPLTIPASGGPSNFLGLSADITDLVTTALGLPPLHGSGSFLGVGGSYTLLDITTGLNLGATQALNLTATPLVAYTVVETGAHPTSFTSSMMNVGTPFSFTFASGDNNASVTPTYFLSADLMNNTGLELSASAALQALAASIGPVSIGPLINLNTTFPIANLSVFDSTFPLLGWNEFQGQTFDVSQTPEPGTLILFGSGLLALASRVRRRKNTGVVASI